MILLVINFCAESVHFVCYQIKNKFIKEKDIKKS